MSWGQGERFVCGGRVMKAHRVMSRLREERVRVQGKDRGR